MFSNNWSYCFSCFKIKYWRKRNIYHASIKNILPLSSSSLSGLLWTQLTIVFFQTFCTVSIRFQKSFIQRFSASSSLFIFPPWNCVSFFWNCVSAIILNLHLPPRHVCDRMNCEREKEKRNLLNLLFLDQQPAQIDKTDRFTSPQYPIVLATASLSSDVWSLESIQFPCSNDWKSSLVTTVVQFRKTAVYLSVNQYFDYLVMLTILANCAFLAMTEPINEAE